MMDPTDRQAASRGFTVVELLVALGLAAVVFGLIVSFFANMSRSTTTQNAAAAAQQTARAGVDFMAQELRLAGLDPLNSAGAGIEQILGPPRSVSRPTAAMWRSATAAPARTRCRTGTSTARTNECPTGTMPAVGLCAATCMRAPPVKPGHRCWSRSSRTPATSRFSRFVDGNDSPTTVLGDIRTVIITLTVQEPAGRSKTVTRTYSSRVRLRNIGL